jgi:hypothetical protein
MIETTPLDMKEVPENFMYLGATSELGTAYNSIVLSNFGQTGASPARLAGCTLRIVMKPCKNFGPNSRGNHT